MPVTRLPFAAIASVEKKPHQPNSLEFLDLNTLCNPNPGGSYLMQVEGHSMSDIGIMDGSVLVVDRTLTAEHGDIVVASIHGGFTVKELCLTPTPSLLPHNVNYTPILIEGASDYELFGVVVSVIVRIK